VKFQSLFLGLLPIDLIDIAFALVYLYSFLAGFCGRIFYRVSKPHIRRAWVLWAASALAALTWPFGMRAYYLHVRGDMRRIVGKWAIREIEKIQFHTPSLSAMKERTLHDLKNEREAK
jgi:hypothetical protein